jgi:hypothetical protein
MQIHRFAVGETVLYTEQRFPNLSWKAPYTVVTCLPTTGAQPQYQIRSDHRSVDRVASEHELSQTLQLDRAFRRVDGRSLEDCVASRDATQQLVPWADLPRTARHKNDRRQELGGGNV